MIRQLFDRAREMFPSLTSAHYQSRGGAPCAVGCLELAYAAMRRQLGLGYVHGCKFGPFPYPRSGGVFLQGLLREFGVNVELEWAQNFANQVMSINDGEWCEKSKSFKRVPAPDLAWAKLTETLEALVDDTDETAHSSFPVLAATQALVASY